MAEIAPIGAETQRALALEQRYLAHNYQPLDVAIAAGQGAIVTDELGKEYFDLVGAYSAVSQGHTHPRIYQAMLDQANTVGVTGRYVLNLLLGHYAAKLCQLVERGDPEIAMKMLPMNSGSEAVDTAIKMSLRWAYDKKGIPDGEGRIIAAKGNFHGRTMGALSLSTTPEYRKGFEPLADNIDWVDFGDEDALESVITDKTAAFFVEPIQGEGGVIVPPAGYLKKAPEISRKHNVLLVADEVQTGLGRTGKWLASWHDDVQPDVVILGKALGGGVYPVSAVVGKAEVMDVFEPGSHGSTWGGNPIACAVAMESLDVIEDEGLAAQAAKLGNIALERLKAIRSPHVKEARGKGLLLGVELDQPARPVCERLAQLGSLSVPTHDNVVRFSPPLIISEEQLHRALDLVEQAILEMN